KLRAVYHNNCMNSRICEQFATKLKTIREAKNLSKGELSVEADVSKSYIGKIESGKKSPSLVTIGKLATALNVPVKELFDFE
ncbi:MAG: helix-turn-helix transcriptional regulator, partial [Candidatus Gastranaerophilales bacterium]|nr:helix-turn-helix transcriptional regulator [Candidatus Gastranaerophilales bacterium]